jgi:hypothetical protein
MMTNLKCQQMVILTNPCIIREAIKTIIYRHGFNCEDVQTEQFGFTSSPKPLPWPSVPLARQLVPHCHPSTPPLKDLILVHFLFLLHIYPPNGRYSIHQNVEMVSTCNAATPQKLKLHNRYRLQKHKDKNTKIYAVSMS